MSRTPPEFMRIQRNSAGFAVIQRHQPTSSGIRRDSGYLCRDRSARAGAAGQGATPGRRRARRLPGDVGGLRRPRGIRERASAGRRGAGAPGAGQAVDAREHALAGSEAPRTGMMTPGRAAVAASAVRLVTSVTRHPLHNDLGLHQCDNGNSGRIGYRGIYRCCAHSGNRECDLTRQRAQHGERPLSPRQCYWRDYIQRRQRWLTGHAV